MTFTGTDQEIWGMKNMIMVAILLSCINTLGQGNSSPKDRTDSISHLSFVIPQFFEYRRTDSLVFMEMRNNDTSVCQMRIFPSFRMEKGKEVRGREIWKRYVMKDLKDADSLPLRSMPDTVKNGWTLRTAIGNYREGGKKAIVFVYLFTKGEDHMVAICNFSDRIFRQPVEKFDKGLQPR